MMTNDEAIWQSLGNILLVGAHGKRLTDFQIHESGAGLTAALRSARISELDGRNESRSLLRMAALTAPHRRAGRLPATAQAARPAPAPAERLPRCPVRAGKILHRLIVQENAALISEWVSIATERGLRAQEANLPDLLALCKKHPRWRSMLLPVLGERGRWLAKQNPAWRGAVPAAEDLAWQAAPRQERPALLEALRDLHPDEALDALIAAWDKTIPPERAELLASLQTGLSSADEPFLNQALQDSYAQVRMQAAHLLVQLPESRLVQRLTDRAMQVVRWKTRLLGAEIQVRAAENLPVLEGELCDLRMVAGSKSSSAAAALQTLLGCVPPARWQAQWRKTPTAILQAKMQEKWQDALITGWSDAAIRFHDTDWLTALILYETRQDDPQRLLQLFRRLPAPLQEEMLLQLFASSSPSLKSFSTASTWLAVCPPPWSARLSRAVIRAIVSNMQSTDLQPLEWELLLRAIGPCFHPDTLADAIQSLSSAQQLYVRFDPYISELLHLLAKRLELRQAFQPRYTGGNDDDQS